MQIDNEAPAQQGKRINCLKPKNGPLSASLTRTTQLSSQLWYSCHNHLCKLNMFLLVSAFQFAYSTHFMDSINWLKEKSRKKVFILMISCWKYSMKAIEHLKLLANLSKNWTPKREFVRIGSRPVHRTDQLPLDQQLRRPHQFEVSGQLCTVVTPPNGLYHKRIALTEKSTVVFGLVRYFVGLMDESERYYRNWLP